MKKCIRHFYVLVLLMSSQAFAGSTGKIAGVIMDAQTGEALPGVNVIIENTSMGAATDPQGRYIILNVPPGVYEIRATMMGYKNHRVSNVRISIDLTTTIDMKLEETILEASEEVTIVAQRPMIIKDQTASMAVVDDEQIKSLPVTEISEAVELQAGLVKDAGGGLHIRGGRSGEISYWIDGMPVTDVYDGGSVVEVNKNMVQELQVVSGAFNAEYGQAMSGIVNIATKNGSNNFGGSFTAYMGDYVSGHQNKFMHIDALNPLAIQNVDGSIQGALIKDKLFYYVNGRYNYNEGYIYGQRLYNPNAVTFTATLNNAILQEKAPEYYADSRALDANRSMIQYIVGTNDYLDSLVVFSNLSEDKIADPDSFAHYYNTLKEKHKNARGNGNYVPMSFSRKYYGQGKLIYKLTPSAQFSYNFIYDAVNYNEWSAFDDERSYKYNPDGAPQKNRIGSTHILQFTHALNSTTFYKIGMSYFTKSFEKYVYEDDHDSRYVHPDLALLQPFSYRTGGTAGTALGNGNFQRKTQTLLTKMDLTSQITPKHQIKTGIEFRTHDVTYKDYLLRPITSQITIDPIFEGPFIQTQILHDSTIYHSEYNHNPTEFSAYIQDKMEFDNLIINMGVRFDYFKPDGIVLVDESDPSIYNPIRPENRYHDYGSDGLANTNDTDGTENNGIWDDGEAAVTLAERQAYWYRNATSKWKISPRLGISFPITARGMIYFSYGHFFQIPRFERLYQNPDFELDSGTGNVGIIGNADLKPEQTVSGEIGLQQQLTDDISLNLTGYFRDIRGLTGTRAQEIVIYGGSARYSKFINSDFGIVKGLVVALNRRISNNLSASFDYTLQTAKGSNSDPEAARNALAGGSLPEVQLTALDWDQKHTVNATVSYTGPDFGTSLIARWGSGLPYSPRRSKDVTALLTNSQRKPQTYNVDIRAFKAFKLGDHSLTAFLRIFNLLDTLNEINVFTDTGRAGFSTDQAIDEATNPPETINTLDDWYINPTFYSPPRRIELGFTIDF